MSPSDRPAAVVLAADAGLVAAALHRPFLAAPALLLARSARSALIVAAAGALAVAWGSTRVADLDRRSLAPGPETAVATVTGQPSGSRAAAAIAGAGDGHPRRAERARAGWDHAWATAQPLAP
jgi:hypothetical protein